MEWKDRRQSSNVDDRRGQQVRGGSRRSSAAGGMLMTLFFRSGIKTKLFMVIAAVVAMFVFGITPATMLNFVGVGGGGGAQPTVTRVSPAPNDEMRAFLATIKADNEDVWARLFSEMGQQYRAAKMVIYSDKTVLPGGVDDPR
ncbi:MAG: neutral zinc metallopeptidase, partial [Verrucomicrobiales bacterium]|nr:neutral zinc metallopeptidase [Verrucomicrobiales bacterium]